MRGCVDSSFAEGGVDHRQAMQCAFDPGDFQWPRQSALSRLFSRDILAQARLEPGDCTERHIR